MDAWDIKRTKAAYLAGTMASLANWTGLSAAPAA